MNAHLPLVSSPHSGYALVTSMLLLLVMTVLGISMYGNTQVQEQMAFNTLVKNRTFIAANSILQQYWSNEDMASKAAEGTTDSLAAGYNVDLDGDGTADDIIITGQITLSLIGGVAGIGAGDEVKSGLGEDTIKQTAFQATATATETETNTTTTVEQGGFSFSGFLND